MIRIGQKIALGFLVFVSAGSLYAQNNLNDTLRIAQVSVHGQSPLAGSGMFKLDSLQLRQNREESLSRLLSEQSPVFIKSAAPGSLATISMRGTLASHTRVLWNGIPLNSPMLGQVDFSLIPAYFSDQVVILSGPAALQSGSGGLGGTIDLSSFGRWQDQGYGSLMASWGSFKTYKYFAEAGGGRSKWHFRIRMLHDQSQNNFPFLNTANGLFNEVRQENADYKKKALLSQFFWRPDENNLLHLDAWIQGSTRNLPPIMSYEGSGRQEYQLDDQIRFSSGWQHKRQLSGFKVTSGLSYDHLNYYLGHDTGGGLLVNYNTESSSLSWYNQLETSYQISNKHKLSAQLSYNRHEVDIHDKTTLSGYTANRQESGIQIRADQTWSEQINTYMILEHDWVGNLNSGLIPVLGGSWSIIPKRLKINSTIGRNFHAPTLNDLFWIPGGNPDLLPEKAWQADLGFQAAYSTDSLWEMELGVTGFASYIKDWILWSPSDFRYWTPNNLATVLARGLENTLKLSVYLDEWTLQLRSNYTYTRTNQIQTGSEIHPQLIYIPIHKSSNLIDIQRHKWSLTYSHTYTSERFTGTSDEISLHRLPAYSLHNLSLGKRFQMHKYQADIRLRINNLLDTDYQSVLWRAMPGRSFLFSFKIDF